MSIYTETIELINESLSIDISRETRKREYVEGRYIYYHICRKKYGSTFEQIGRSIGKNHATVMHGIEIFNNLIASSRDFREKVGEVELCVLGGDISLDNDSYDIDELISENKKLKTEINKLTLKTETLEHEVDKVYRFKSIMERLQYQVPRGKELEVEKQINRFLNGLRL